MAMAPTLIKRNSCPGGEVHLYLTLTGTYTTGGDVLNFRAYSGTTKPPYLVIGSSDAGNTVSYDSVTGKLAVRTPAGAEIAAAAAPPAGLKILAIFPKFG